VPQENLCIYDVKISGFILVVNMYTLDREDRVSGVTSVTLLHSSQKSRDRGKNYTGTEKEKVGER
jgi:hypothetical protein